MAQQNINVGTVANDGTGDTFRGAFVKTEANFTDLYSQINAAISGSVFLSQESDFPSQDATTITLESDTQYVLTTSFTVTKRFVVEDGASITANSVLSHVLTFSGSGTMFTGTDAGFFIHDIQVTTSATNKIFDFTDTVGQQKTFICSSVLMLQCGPVGSFDDMNIVEFFNSAANSCTTGIDFTNDVFTWSFNRFAMVSTSASFVGIDLGTSTGTIIEFQNLFMSAPAGAIGISGTANNGNVPTGRLGMVSGCEFTGGMTSLQNITNEDTRWIFKDNTPISDTVAGGLLSIIGNSTQTTMVDTSTPVLAAGTWTVERDVLYTGTTGGRLTYEAERDAVFSIDASVSIDVSSGSNQDLEIYFALNGTVIANSVKSRRISSGSVGNVALTWKQSLSEDDYIEIFLLNTTSSSNNPILVDCTFRIL